MYFRAGDVIVRNNIIRRAAFSAIRGNAASNIQIIGNNCARARTNRAMYAEFDFEGAIVADNVIDMAENGIAITNFNNGGRLATVHGNLLRNLGGRRPDTPPEGRRRRHRRRGRDRRHRQRHSRTRPMLASAPAGAPICATSP